MGESLPCKRAHLVYRIELPNDDAAKKILERCLKGLGEQFNDEQFYGTQGKFDVLVFYKVDRLARSLRNFLNIVDFFEDIGVGLRSMTETFDTTTPMGRFAVQMMAAVAELERGTIMERMAMGRARVAAQGRWTGGPVPYGYILDAEGQLIPNWTVRDGYTFSEAEVVQRIFREIGDEGRSGIAVAARLNAEGVPMWLKYQARNAEPTYKTKPGAIWTIDNIVRMVHTHLPG